MKQEKGEALTELPEGKGVVIRSKAEPKVKRPAHRPSGYNDEITKEICLRIMSGRPLSKVCLDDDMPCRDTVHVWLVEHKNFSDSYVRACNIRREFRFETLEDVVDKEDDPARARIKVDVIKWQLSKEEPKKYGDKMDMTTNGKDLPSPVLSSIIPKDTIDDVISLT